MRPRLASYVMLLTAVPALAELPAPEQALPPETGRALSASARVTRPQPAPADPHPAAIDEALLPAEPRHARADSLPFASPPAALTASPQPAPADPRQAALDEALLPAEPLHARAVSLPFAAPQAALTASSLPTEPLSPGHAPQLALMESRPASDALPLARAEPSPPTDAQQPPPTEPPHPALAPLLTPLSLLVPGTGHLIRHEPKAGVTLLGVGGGGLGLALLSGVFIATTGASDVSIVVGVPLAILGLGAFFTAGAADIVGTWSRDDTPLVPGTERDAWNATWRGGAKVLFANREGLVDRPAVSLFGQWRSPRLLLMAEGGTLPGLPEGWFDVGAGARVVGYGAAAPKAGLWVEASVRHDVVRQLGFDSTRLRVSAVSTLPLGLLSPRLARLTSLARLGVDPAWTRFLATGHTSAEVNFSGGFELRLAVTDWLRPFAGYEHSREGLVGGGGGGFVGIFFAGLEVNPWRGLVLSARFLAGSPTAVQLGLEWRS